MPRSILIFPIGLVVTIITILFLSRMTWNSLFFIKDCLKWISTLGILIWYVILWSLQTLSINWDMTILYSILSFWMGFLSIVKHQVEFLFTHYLFKLIGMWLPYFSIAIFYWQRIIIDINSKNYEFSNHSSFFNWSRNDQL